MRKNSSSRSFSLCVGVLLLLSFCMMNCQIKVVEPPGLANNFISVFPPEGVIPGSTSMFGSPRYGEKLSGRLVYAKSASVHCEKDYFATGDLPKATSDKTDEFNSVIIMVERGKCPFVAKVRIAEEYGAVAVLIIDTGDNTLHTVVSDDGHAGHIRIPSILVDKHVGKQLIEAVQKSDVKNSNDKNSVYVELTWEVPPGDVALLDFWYSPSAEEGVRFLVELAPLAKELKEVMTLRPHLHLQSQPEIYPELCYDPLGTKRTKYCEDDPDGPGPTTGSHVVQEGLRQYCLNEETKVAMTINGVKKKTTDDDENEVLIAEYSEEFFKYIVEWNKKCSIAASEGRKWAKKMGKSVDDSYPDPFTLDCSRRILHEIGVAPDLLDGCSTGQAAEDFLAKEKDTQSWDVVALRINQQRFGGKLDAALAVRAICTSFDDPPDICNRPTEGFSILTPNTDGGGGMPWWGVLLIVLLVLAIVGVAFFFYKKYMEKNVRNSLRMEVMMEVKSQMQDYRRLPEEN